MAVDPATDILAADLPIFQDYLSSLSLEGENLLEKINGLLKEVEGNEFETENGISLLDVKYHYLLDYVINVILLIILKLSGRKTAECPARVRLIEDRIVMEKSTPLEHKIKYQIDKLLQQACTDYTNDPLSFKPNIDDLEIKGEEFSTETEENTTEKKYVPPRIAASHYDFEEDENRRQKQARERALKKSSIIMDLAQESSELPTEISEFSSGRRKVLKEREERKKYEETNLTRINLSKKQKNSERQLMKRSELDTITKFGDISALEGNFTKTKSFKRKAGGKYKTGKKWKRFKK